MARSCSICTHADRASIDLALVNGMSLRDIAGRFGPSKSSLERHKADHIPALLAKAEQAERAQATTLQVQADQKEARETGHALDVMTELRRIYARVDLLFDACDRWLRDPDDPSRYDVGARADDVQVIYSEWDGDRVVQRKASLATLLVKAEKGTGITVQRGEFRHADPRELVLKTADRLQGSLELLAKLLGQLNERPQINLLVAPEWLATRTALLEALAPYPEARIAVSQRLVALEASA